MAITTYATLKAAITNWTHRAGLTDYLDEFIDLTEARLSRELHMSEMETRATITADAEYIALPSGAMEIRNVQVNTSPVQTVNYRTPQQMDAANTGEAGTPRFYTIIGNEFQLYPVPTSSTLEVTYYKSITPLDDTNTSNFLLTSHPEIYLHGCLYHAYLFTQDAQASVHGQEFARLIADLNRTSKRKKFSGAPMQVMTA